MDYSKVGIIQQNHFSFRLVLFVIETMNDGGRSPLIVFAKHVLSFLYILWHQTQIQFHLPTTHFQSYINLFASISLIKDCGDKTAMYLIIQVFEIKKKNFSKKLAAIFFAEYKKNRILFIMKVFLDLSPIFTEEFLFFIICLVSSRWLSNTF